MTDKILNLIVAVDSKMRIGNAGPHKLVFKQKSDMDRFKKLTTGNVVIMGYNTYKSIGKALPNRENIVVSSSHFNEIFRTDVIESAASLEEAIDIAKTYTNKEVFLIGGGQLYNYAIHHDLVKRYFVTMVYTNIDGDLKVEIPILPIKSVKMIESKHDFASINKGDEFDSYYSVFEIK
jgi:dihydrofolate reductase